MAVTVTAEAQVQSRASTCGQALSHAAEGIHVTYRDTLATSGPKQITRRCRDNVAHCDDVSAWKGSTLELSVQLCSMPTNTIVCCALASESGVFIEVLGAGVIDGLVVRTTVNTKTVYRKQWLDVQTRVDALSRQLLYELRQHP